jgi:hypothetical protein
MILDPSLAAKAAQASKAHAFASQHTHGVEQASAKAGQKLAAKASTLAAKAVTADNHTGVVAS